MRIHIRKFSAFRKEYSPFINGAYYRDPILKSFNVHNPANNTDNTKKMQFNLSGLSTASTVSLAIPNYSTTLVGIDSTQTLTNKTINASNNTITNIVDANIMASAAINANKIANVGSLGAIQKIKIITMNLTIK